MNIHTGHTYSCTVCGVDFGASQKKGCSFGVNRCDLSAKRLNMMAMTMQNLAKMAMAPTTGTTEATGC